MELLTQNKLPPINTGRNSARPGFAGFDKDRNPLQEKHLSQQSTPVFNDTQKNKDRLKQVWDGYARDYEKEMRM